MHFEVPELTVDTRGHRHVHREGDMRDILDNRLEGTVVRNVSLNGPGLDEHTTLDDLTMDEKRRLFVSVFGAVFDCATCGAHAMFHVVENADGPHGIGLRATTSCTLPNGAATITQLDVSSKRVVLGAALSRLNSDIDTWPSISSVAGQILAAQAHSARNTVYIQLADGDSGALFRLAPGGYSAVDGGRYQIYACSLGYDGEGEEADGLTAPGMPILGERASLVATTGYDHNWIHLMDHGDFLTRCAELDLDLDEEFNGHGDGTYDDLTIVDFPNGLYQIVDHTTRIGYRDDAVTTHHTDPADRVDEDGEELWEPGDAYLVADIFMVFPQSMRQHRARHAALAAERDAETD